MTTKDEIIVVLGATGQQGGATAKHLVQDGWRVRAIVRDAASPKARALAAAGIELAGDLNDRASLDAALRGAHGVFSVQPSAGQPQYGVTVGGRGPARARASRTRPRPRGVKHLVYTSGRRRGARRGRPAPRKQVADRGAHPRHRPPRHRSCARPRSWRTSCSPASRSRRARSCTSIGPERPIPLIAADDIGAFAALAFRDPDAYAGTVLALVGDQLTGHRAGRGHEPGREARHPLCAVPARDPPPEPRAGAGRRVRQRPVHHEGRHPRAPPAAPGPARPSSAWLEKEGKAQARRRAPRVDARERARRCPARGGHQPRVLRDPESVYPGAAWRSSRPGPLPVASVLWASAPHAFALTVVCRGTFRLAPVESGARDRAGPAQRRGHPLERRPLAQPLRAQRSRAVQAAADVILVGNALRRAASRRGRWSCGSRSGRSTSRSRPSASDPSRRRGSSGGARVVRVPLRWERARAARRRATPWACASTGRTVTAPPPSPTCSRSGSTSIAGGSTCRRWARPHRALVARAPRAARPARRELGRRQVDG